LLQRGAGRKKQPFDKLRADGFGIVKSDGTSPKKHIDEESPLHHSLRERSPSPFRGGCQSTMIFD